MFISVPARYIPLTSSGRDKVLSLRESIQVAITSESTADVARAAAWGVCDLPRFLLFLSELGRLDLVSEVTDEVLGHHSYLALTKGLAQLPAPPPFGLIERLAQLCVWNVSTAQDLETFARDFIEVLTSESQTQSPLTCLFTRGAGALDVARIGRFVRWQSEELVDVIRSEEAECRLLVDAARTLPTSWRQRSRR